MIRGMLFVRQKLKQMSAINPLYTTVENEGLMCIITFAHSLQFHRSPIQKRIYEYLDILVFIFIHKKIFERRTKHNESNRKAATILVIRSFTILL